MSSSNRNKSRSKSPQPASPEDFSTPQPEKSGSHIDLTHIETSLSVAAADENEMLQFSDHELLTSNISTPRTSSENAIVTFKAIVAAAKKHFDLAQNAFDNIALHQKYEMMSIKMMAELFGEDLDRKSVPQEASVELRIEAMTLRRNLVHISKRIKVYYDDLLLEEQIRKRKREPSPPETYGTAIVTAEAARYGDPNQHDSFRRQEEEERLRRQEEERLRRQEEERLRRQEEDRLRRQEEERLRQQEEEDRLYLQEIHQVDLEWFKIDTELFKLEEKRKALLREKQCQSRRYDRIHESIVKTRKMSLSDFRVKFSIHAKTTKPIVLPEQEHGYRAAQLPATNIHRSAFRVPTRFTTTTKENDHNEDRSSNRSRRNILT